MSDFLKTIILVAIFYGLILFSFLWFNKGEGGLRNVPYVESFFGVVGSGSNWLDKKSIDFSGFKAQNNDKSKRTDSEKENKKKIEFEDFLPISKEEWNNFFKK